MTDPKLMSEHLSLTEEQLRVCRAQADALPLRPPFAVRQLHEDHALLMVGPLVFRRPFRDLFPDFLTDHLKYTFGPRWADEQRCKPSDKQHAVWRWWQSLCDGQRASAEEAIGGTSVEVEPSGDAAEFLSLADDLYRLRLLHALPPKLVNRLRHHVEFQGARFECSVAAAFLRAGFRVSWEDGTGPKCEFTAYLPDTNDSIAIEVKSRRRPGILNEAGRSDINTYVADVRSLYEKALAQCPADRPCGIFVDVNMPPPARDHGKWPWQDDIQRLLSSYPTPTSTHPAVETCLVFVNSGWHYAGRNRAGGRSNVPTFPQYARRTFEDWHTFAFLLKAIDAWGWLPQGKQMTMDPTL